VMGVLELIAEGYVDDLITSEEYHCLVIYFDGPVGADI
jgi:hypothetical protein